MFHRRAAGPSFGQGGQEDVAEPLLLVFGVPLLLQDAERGADGGVAGLVGQRGPDFGGGGAAQLVEHVEDLALASAEMLENLHRAQKLAVRPDKCQGK